MNVMLQQKDITINQHHSPSYELIKENIITREMYEKVLFEKIDRRIEQINDLKRLKDEELSDEDFYQLISRVYTFKYENISVLNVNLLSEYDLLIRIGVNGIKKYDPYKFYTINEIYELFDKDEILVDNINLEEFCAWYYKEIYDVERNNFELLSWDKFGNEYSKLRDNLINSYNKLIINRLRSIITKERIEKDYKNLIDFTNQEIKYLKNIDSDIKVHQLTY